VRIPARGGSRWHSWGGVALVLLLVAGLLVFGYHRFTAWRDRPSEARRIAEAATVAGFVRAAVKDVPVGDSSPWAEAIFIGPAPKPNILRVVSVPTIRLNAVAPQPAPPVGDKPLYYIVVAAGHRPDGCSVNVAFNLDPKPEDVNSILTDQQVDDVRNGTRVLIELMVNGCTQ